MKLIRNFVAVGVLFASGAFANNLLNGSFENGSFNNNSLGTNDGQLLNVGSTSLSSWSIIANGGTTPPTLVWMQTGDYGGLTSQDGSLFLDLTGFDVFPFGGISQVVNLAASGNYALTFWLGVDQSIVNDSGPVTVKASAGSTSGTFTSASSGTGNIWTQQTLTFSAATSGNVTISLLGNTVPTGHQYIGLDNVDLEYLGTGVPEPAMILPLAFAGVLFVLSSRKRARQ